jgi:L-threonylcarbamoyladenylate synthase
MGSGLFWRPMPANAKQAAHDVFGVLRDFDARGVRTIWIETPPNTPDWEGVRDRLQRAAA